MPILKKDFKGLEYLRGWRVLDVQFFDFVLQRECSNLITAIWFESGIHWWKLCGMYLEEIEFYVHSGP